MHLCLINPSNPIVNTVNLKDNRWNQYRIWKPLSLLVIAGLTPPEWEVTIIDENLKTPDYSSVPKPDLVGITAFTSQAERAYEIAKEFRKRGVPVVMGGIHATMCLEEASEHVDSVVTNEAESVWAQVLEDVKQGTLKKVYKGLHQQLDNIPFARHDLLPNGYRFGSIQTTRGCPLCCSFCSVTIFNGRHYRHRPIEDVINELKIIKEKHVLIVDDNLIGTSTKHISRAKELFRAMIREKIEKKWMAQVTINISDDDELLELASKAGCFGIFIGFESIKEEGLIEVNKRFNLKRAHNLKSAVRRIQRHGIMVVGSFIMGLDIDEKGIGKQIALTAIKNGIDVLNVMFLTPLPGTVLWDRMESEERITARTFPHDWRYYTLAFPVARYKHLSWTDMINEINSCYRTFYSYPRIFLRIISSFWRTHRTLNVFVTMASNFSYRFNMKLDNKRHHEINLLRGGSTEEKERLSIPTG